MKVKNVFTYFTDTILRRNANSYRNPRVRWAVRQYKLLFYTARGLIAHDTICLLYTSPSPRDRG